MIYIYLVKLSRRQTTCAPKKVSGKSKLDEKLLLMAEILRHLGYVKIHKSWDKNKYKKQQLPIKLVQHFNQKQ